MFPDTVFPPDTDFWDTNIIDATPPEDTTPPPDTSVDAVDTAPDPDTALTPDTAPDTDVDTADASGPTHVGWANAEVLAVG